MLFWLSGLLGMPSTCFCLNYHIKKNVFCYFVFIINLVFQFSFSVYTKFFECVHHFTKKLNKKAKLIKTK